MKYRITFTPQAVKNLKGIKDQRVQAKIYDAIESLSPEPEKRGKPLVGELAGLYSLRAVGQRYRIIYKIEKSKILIIVIAVGVRREKEPSDIYALAQKLVRLLNLEKLD